MIERLTIENFQAHKSTTVEFSPRVTAFVGLNNHGKSSIFRAFMKVVRDVPDGTVFITDHQDTCRITLENSNYSVIRQVKRSKSSDSNFYEVENKKTGEKLPFYGFGKTGIPEIVKDALQISDTQKFGDIEFDFNFREQHDLLFLVIGQGLASTRGKVFGKITGIDFAYRAIQVGSQTEKKLSLERTTASANKAKVEIDLLQYNNIDYLQSIQQNISTSLSSSILLRTDIDLFQRIHLDATNIVKQAFDVTALLKTLDVDFDSFYNNLTASLNIIKLLRDIDFLTKSFMYYETVSCIIIPEYNPDSLKYDIKSLIEVNFLQSQISLLFQISLIEVPDQQVPDLLTTYSEINTFITAKVSLDTIEYSRQVLLDEIITLDKEINQQQILLLAIEKELRVCPTCGKPFDIHIGEKYV